MDVFMRPRARPPTCVYIRVIPCGDKAYKSDHMKKCGVLVCLCIFMRVHLGVHGSVYTSQRTM